MNSKTKKNAIEQVLEETKTRNYRKHIADDMMKIIINDVLDTLEKQYSPKRKDE